MLKAKRIYVTRAEGTREECSVSHVCDSFTEANAVLRWMARTAPDTGGYDKCDFRVIYEDGNTYDGRFDLVFMGNPTLEGHMRDHVEFSAGVRLPSHLVSRYGEKQARERYDSYLRDVVTAEGVEEYKKFLATYALGD